MSTTSVISVPIQRPSPSDHRVGSSSLFTRLCVDSLALRPALLLFGNSRPRVTTTPLPHATGAYRQLPGGDFNPLDLLLLLRTGRLELSIFLSYTARGIIGERIRDSHGTVTTMLCQGQTQHILQRGNNREPIFADAADTHYDDECLQEAAEQQGLAIRDTY